MLDSAAAAVATTMCKKTMLLLCFATHTHTQTLNDNADTLKSSNKNYWVFVASSVVIDEFLLLFWPR